MEQIVWSDLFHHCNYYCDGLVSLVFIYEE